MKKVSKYIPVELDKVRNLRLGMVAMSLVEEYFNKPLSKIDLENLTMKESAVIIWAGLYHEDPELTVEKVMQLIDDYSDLVTVSTALGKAMEVGMGESEGKEKN